MSFLTNAGIDLSQVEKEVLQHEDDLEGYIDDLIAAGSNYDYRGFFEPGTGRKMRVTKDQLNLTFDQLMRMRDNNTPIKPMFSIKAPNGRQMDIYPDVVQGAFDSGYICESCTEWQAVPNAPECNWLHNADKTANGKGCGSKLLLP